MAAHDTLLRRAKDRPESDEATAELLEVPGFLELFERAEQDVRAGRLTPVERLRRKLE